MSAPRIAQVLLNQAKKDLKALAIMLDSRTIDVEIYGFHAQQAVEKALKAWLCLGRVEYPKIHDLEELFYLLENKESNIPISMDILRDLTNFSVFYRYEDYDDYEKELDRPFLLQQITNFINHVETLVKKVDL